jgi:phosphate/sulfate permease
MARDDDSFWLDIFRKSPLIATFMAIGGLIGIGVGVFLFSDLNRLPPIRMVLCVVVSTGAAGVFVGLIVGVIVDSIFGAARKKGKKKRKDDWRV